ncbi:MAG: SMC-Scp complex subunit ScpB [Proteobacteria bacterium]|jgi:segregation and condensation protein B|nr:SMC-Scp complex subunit ScpB [Pseudomonadota bacterium]
MSDGKILPFPGGPEAPAPLVAVVEALLFASGEPVSMKDLKDALGNSSTSEVKAALSRLQHRYDGPESGMQLARVGPAWQLRSDTRFAEQIRRLLGTRPQRMTQPAMETLSIVAYRQPVIKPEIEELRGVDSGGVLRTLMDRGLIRICGRREIPGRPMEYATTTAFLEMFSLTSLRDLPHLDEYEDPLEDE